MRQLHIALAQMTVRLADPQANLATARRLVAQAAQAGAELVVLPELWGSGYDLAHAADYATPLDEGLFAEMGALARQHGLYLVGSLLEADRAQVYNTGALFGPDGLIGTYRKLHRFRLMQEDQYLGAGDETPIFDMPWGPTAMAICYDLRFPELFRGYAVAGARLILLPAEWPVRRVDHWRALVMARAIENQCVVAACNRTGSDADGEFNGHSLAVGPWGEVLVEAGEAEGLFLAQVDWSKVDEARRFMPVFDDRRPECYRRLEAG